MFGLHDALENKPWQVMLDLPTGMQISPQNVAVHEHVV
jgi:hypothetical protein